MSFGVNLLFGIIVILYKCSNQLIFGEVKDLSVKVVEFVEHFRERVKNREERSGEAHTREERNVAAFLCNEPLKVLLKDTLSRDAVLTKNSIQAGLCGPGLPATIEQFDPGFTNAGDQVTMEEHICTVGVRNHLSICRLPILTSSDGGVHLGFDLTHDQRE